MSKEFGYTDNEYSVTYEKIESHDFMNDLKPEIEECLDEFTQTATEFSGESYENTADVELVNEQEQSKKAHKKLVRKMVYMLASVVTVVSLAQTIETTEDDSNNVIVDDSQNISATTENIIVFSGKGVLTVDEVKREFEKHNLTEEFCVVIEEGYTEIEAEAFKNYAGMVSVEIPDSVTVIGKEAFANCTDLKIEKMYTTNRIIGSLAFREVTIHEVNISETFEGYRNLGLASFENANIETVSFEKGITKIPEYCLVGCTKLTEIIIPETVTEIGEYAFFGCSGLNSITIPNSVTTIEREAFANCTELKIEKLYTANRTIGPLAFSEVTIHEVNISETFEGHKNLGLASFETANVERVSFEKGITKIPEYCLVGCTKLTEIIIPETVTEIGEYAFWGCSELNSVTIPDSVILIADTGFDVRDNLHMYVIGGSYAEKYALQKGIPYSVN